MSNYLKSSFLLLGLACSFSAEVLAQGTVEDYNRAYSLRQKYSARKVLYSDVVPHWINKSDAFWYIRNTEKGKEYVKVDASDSKRIPLFNHEKLSAALSELSGKEVEPYALSLNSVLFNERQDTLRCALSLMASIGLIV